MNPILKPILTIIILLNFSACIHVKTGDGSKEIEKNGSEVTDNRAVEAFNHLDINGVFEVFLKQGDQESLVIEADKAVAKHIISKLSNNTLYLSMEDDYDFGDIDPIKIYVQVKDLKSLKNEGVGTVTCQNPLKLDQLSVNCEGVGATDLKLSANSLILKSETVGAITLAGKVKDADITHNGVGVLQAFELLTQHLKLSSEGVGAAEVYASESIDITANGVGSVQYKGNPKTKNIKSEGIGKVEAVD